jgi:hypothetical protein
MSSVSLPQLAVSYVRELENKLARVERLVREVHSDVILPALANGLNLK